ncbi:MULTISPECIES: hypothetical protein [Henriciella]|uniref:hypothetical protein n=1 Tax=Henriciella TaxID=453849 RepID=UPI0035132E0A
MTRHFCARNLPIILCDSRWNATRFSKAKNLNHKIQNMPQIKILISYPDDQTASVKSVKSAVQEVAEAYSHQGVQIRTVDWKTNITTGAGARAQDVINEQTADIDGILAIIGARLGSPTGNYKSGVDEEIQRARNKFGISNGRVHVLFNSTSQDILKIDPKELERVTGYQQELSQSGILYSKFQSTSKLKTRVRQAMSKIVSECLTPQEEKDSTPDDAQSPDEQIKQQIKTLRSQVATEDSPVFTAMLSLFESIIPIVSALGGDALTDLLEEKDPDQLSRKILAADSSVTESVMNIKSDLDYLYTRSLASASKLSAEQGAFLEVGQFFLFAIIEMASKVSQIAAADLRDRAYELSNIGISDRRVEYAKDRLANSMVELASIIETTAVEAATITEQLGWRVELPTDFGIEHSEDGET